MILSKKTKHLLLYALAALCVCSLSCQASHKKETLSPAVDIKELGDTLKTIKKVIKFPVLFPTLIKADKGIPYFATPDMTTATQYTISISPEPKCTAKYCQTGLMMAQKGARLKPEYEFVQPEGRERKVKKVKVKLGDKQGYYTRGFTAAGFVNPSVQWYEGDILYTLSWGGVTKQELIQMATSAVTSTQE